MTLTLSLNDDDKATDNRAGMKALDDSIHALAQPLTALLFRLELGALNADPQALLTTLDDARTECMRAVKALQQVRGVAHALGNHALGTTGDLS
jgi:hypothetical protein